MNRLTALWRRLRTVAVAVGLWAACCGVAWAQATSSGSGDKSSTDASGGGASPWVGPYFIVILGVALGLFILCNPSRRRDRAKPEQYQDKLAQQLKTE